MGQVWSDANKFAKWLEVELAATEALAEAGQVPKDAAAAIRVRAKVDVVRIQELEARVKHDVIAFTMAVGESIGDPAAARWLHYGMTSNDVVDTAQALQVRDASKLIERNLVLFGEALDLRAHEFRHTPQIGRTHGVHAEPITFGLKIANWFSENQRNIARFRDAAGQMAVGKISGAVGNASHLGTEIEERICKRLGLTAAPIASQVIKRNPVSCEQICGLARLVRSNMVAAFENVALWHERDISHSSVERVILPDFTILVDYMLHQMTRIIEGLRVYPERMRENLERSYGLMFSQRVLTRLA